MATHGQQGALAASSDRTRPRVEAPHDRVTERDGKRASEWGADERETKENDRHTRTHTHSRLLLLLLLHGRLYRRPPYAPRTARQQLLPPLRRIPTAARGVRSGATRFVRPLSRRERSYVIVTATNPSPINSFPRTYGRNNTYK